MPVAAISFLLLLTQDRSIRGFSNLRSAPSNRQHFATTTINKPHSWRLWDGKGFNIRPANPYPSEPSNPKSYLSKYLSHSHIGELHGSITYNSYLHRYMLVGTEMLPDETGELKCGVWFSTSKDLIRCSSLFKSNQAENTSLILFQRFLSMDSYFFPFIHRKSHARDIVHSRSTVLREI